MLQGTAVYAVDVTHIKAHTGRYLIPSHIVDVPEAQELPLVLILHQVDALVDIHLDPHALRILIDQHLLELVKL